AKRPIANAAWKDLSQQQGMYQKYAADYTERLRKTGVTPADLSFQGDLAPVWPELALRFTLSQPGVHVATIGTTREASARANLEAVGKGPLPQEAIDKLRAAFRQTDPDGAWVALN